jgi:hypothetical protein
MFSQRRNTNVRCMEKLTKAQQAVDGKLRDKYIPAAVARQNPDQQITQRANRSHQGIVPPYCSLHRGAVMKHELLVQRKVQERTQPPDRDAPQHVSGRRKGYGETGEIDPSGHYSGEIETHQGRSRCASNPGWDRSATTDSHRDRLSRSAPR